jgi:hypothetical protein
VTEIQMRLDTREQLTGMASEATEGYYAAAASPEAGDLEAGT